jgi:hypothetical protein
MPPKRAAASRAAVDPASMGNPATPMGVSAAHQAQNDRFTERLIRKDAANFDKPKARAPRAVKVTLRVGRRAPPTPTPASAILIAPPPPPPLPVPNRRVQQWKYPPPIAVTET